MSNVERIQKFLDDAVLLSGKGTDRVELNSQPKVISSNKITSEVNKLKTWLQKHQYESVPDGSKSKLFQTLEIYYSVAICSDKSITEELKNVVGALLNDYLQLPEGKLLGAKDKRKVLNWSMSLGSENLVNPPIAKNSVREYFVLSYDRGFTLLNPQDDEEWIENVGAINRDLETEIIEKLESQENLRVVYDTTSKIIIGIKGD